MIDHTNAFGFISPQMMAGGRQASVWVARCTADLPAEPEHRGLAPLSARRHPFPGCRPSSVTLACSRIACATALTP